MAGKGFTDVRWIAAVKEFRRAHNGRNPNAYEVRKLREELNN